MKAARVVMVGNPDAIHVGAHLYRAGLGGGVDVRFLDSRKAFEAPAPVAKFNWWLRGHRPSRLEAFGAEVVERCRDAAPACLLATGFAPLSARALEALGEMGIRRLNFLTDDPWNRRHRAPWFLEALPHYDHVFSPRRANVEELRGLEGPEVSYLPFAYAPEIHFHEPPAAAEAARFEADVVFAGGADDDRVPYFEAIAKEGFRVALYGGYWNRHRATRRFALGHADAATLRKAVAAAKVSLCLVRRANRDGHSMRTFEIAAMGGCILAEDTADHREIFGEEGRCAEYFQGMEEMIRKLRGLVADAGRRARMAAAARWRMAEGAHTYADRLREMLSLVAEPVR